MKRKPYVPKPTLPDRNEWDRECRCTFSTPKADHNPVRFNLRLNRGGLVRLALSDGDTITHESFALHDEGWGLRRVIITRNGDTLDMAVITEGSDCDGRLDTLDMLESPVDRLTDMGIPDWRLVNARQRDYAAEAMGY